MNRRFTAIALSALFAIGLSTGVATAGHHEKANPQGEDHYDHGKHKGHEKQPDVSDHDLN